MTLQSIKSELAELKALLTGKLSPAQNTDLQTRLTAAEASLSTSEANDATIVALRAELKTAGETHAKDAKAAKDTISDLTTKVEAGLKKANEVIASQGLDPAAVPAAQPSAAGEAVESAFGKYSRLQQTNPQAAGEFYATDAVNILASRPK